ncbi:hypothetical protein KC319_g1138, partial [Hortaea werneckii]
RRATPRTPGRRARGAGAQPGADTAGGAGEADEEEEAEEEDLYSSTPARGTQRSQQTTQSTRGAATTTQDDSQASMASSQPASQLLQDESSSQDPQSTPPITAARLQVFQTALGQLIDGPLFANDAADVEPLVAAVNARLRSGEARYDDAEALKALEELNERNKIMLSGGIVYKL